jgi:multidrug transporter EmrE-like cation transporter
MATFLLIASALAFTLGGVCMKQSDGLRRPLPAALIFALFLLGAALQAVAMRRGELGTVYILVLGLEAVLAFLLGVIVFDESASAAKVAALLLITAGIALLHR